MLIGHIHWSETYIWMVHGEVWMYNIHREDTLIWRDWITSSISNTIYSTFNPHQLRGLGGSVYVLIQGMNTHALLIIIPYLGKFRFQSNFILVFHHIFVGATQISVCTSINRRQRMKKKSLVIYTRISYLHGKEATIFRYVHIGICVIVGVIKPKVVTNIHILTRT